MELPTVAKEQNNCNLRLLFTPEPLYLLRCDTFFYYYYYYLVVLYIFGMVRYLLPVDCRLFGCCWLDPLRLSDRPFVFVVVLSVVC